VGEEGFGVIEGEGMTERDKFLTEAMGLAASECDNCGTKWPEQCGCDEVGIGSGNAPCDCSTWTGFGLLWQWANKQEWWNEFIDITLGVTSKVSSGGQIVCRYIRSNYVDPSYFADALYEYLKERK
jgi:hypothetical protein